jgi:F-type H+-transporting ATPase subunit b
MQDILRVVIPIIVVHALVLAGIILIIRRLLLSDTMRAVERINQVEAEVRKKEEALRKEIEERERELAQRKAEAEEELQRHKEEMAKDVEQLKDKMLADARKESDRIVEQARKSEDRMRQQLELEARQKAAAYGGQVVNLVFSERLLAAIDRHFVDELLDALEAMDTSNITVDLSTSQFIASQPLAEEQRQRLQRILAEKFGAQVAVAETIQKDLLAGLILKLGSLEIDGSLLNRFREAAEEINREAATT